MKQSAKVIVAFILGQAVQVICHAVALNLWAYRQIPFCLAGGFLVTVAVFLGTRIGKEEKPVSYLDWAKVPKDDRRA